LNVEYLNHDTFTDVISFNFSEGTGKIIGDIYISIERVSENAIKFNKTMDNELYRVMAHGLLHLLGYSDKQITKISNDKKEDYCSYLCSKIINIYKIVSRETSLICSKNTT